MELMEYDFQLVHISGKKNRRADTLSRRPDYNQGDNDNKNLVVLPPQFFSKIYTGMVMEQQDKKEERTPLSKDKNKSKKKDLSSSAKVAGSDEADPNNGKEWKHFMKGVGPEGHYSMQNQVEKDQ